MVDLLDLWLPILLSAVFVFIVSSVIHMATPMHKADYKQLPAEEVVLAGMRDQAVRPGQYVFPWAASMQELGTPEMVDKFKRGPVGFLTVAPSSPPNMGPALLQWFLFSILISVFVGYIGAFSLPAGSEASAVFRVAGTVGLLGYAFGEVTQSIWKRLSWAITFRFFIDGILYGLATAATFAWLWPSAA